MSEQFQTHLKGFTLTRSGLFHGFLVRFGMEDDMKHGFLKRSIFLAIFTWLPLFILSAMQGLAFNDQLEVPFWKDFSIHVRFLLVLPLLIFAEGAFDKSLREITNQFFSSGILNDQDLASFDAIKKRVLNLVSSKMASFIILAIVVLNIAVRLMVAKTNNINHWVFVNSENDFSLTWAGIYLSIISVPIFQFLILQWIWRWMVWFIYLKKLAGLPLKLNPAHPDLAGGIGFLGFPPGPFILVNAALSFTLSAFIAQHIIYQHDKLAEYYVAMGVFAFFSIIINVMPLLVFMKPLVSHRRRGYFQYSSLVQEHHREFDDKWLGKPVEEQIRGFTDASSLTDFNSSFETVKNMHVIPFNLKIMVSSIVITILPMIPVFAFEYNLLDLVLKVLGMLV